MRNHINNDTNEYKNLYHFNIQNISNIDKMITK